MRPNALIIARAPLCAFAVMGMMWGTFAAVLPDLKTMLGVDEAQLGLLLFLTPVTAVLAMLVAPAFGAALGRYALPLATIMMAASFALPGQTASMVLFPLAMMACGAATGLTDVLMNARVAALENTHARPLMNLCHALYSLGYAAGALTTGALRAGGADPALVMGSLSVAALVVALFTWDAAGRIDGLRRPTDKAAAALGTLPLIGGAIVLVAFMTENAAESWSALHIEKTLGGSPAQGALGPATLALTMAASRLGGQVIIQRVAPITLLQWGSVVASIGALIAALATSPAMAYAGFIIMGIGASVIAPTAFSMVGAGARPEARARAVARATLLGYFGYFFGPPLLGLIAGSFGLRAAFVVTAIGISFVLVLAPMMRRAR
ncbi:Major Facilitator Superfamily protein [Pseudorhodobacter antarcticus]|jgi:MFS family permease|uniref:Major Facilitator Superfamily protein n=1 Tax=Pseudorhodobacter antarcticus TaxID=1077947 RepID=A0A1H8A6H6_9RHOB|nr:MFS transporter [Pseudorhodobacter antarcticus]SEM66191.1 Major Facilitator Superfamily protein [Pseudorhodobacter antarcticus]